MIVGTNLSPIYVAFLLLAALLLWFVIGARGKWTVKLALIVVVPLFMVLVWGSLGSFQGWPTSAHPPHSAYYVYGYVVEPDANYNIKGKIYVWLIPSKTSRSVLGYRPTRGEARAYVLPYSRQLEAEVQGANQAVAHGQQVGFQAPGKKSGKSSGGHQGSRLDSGKYHFYNLRPGLPPKTPSQ